MENGLPSYNTVSEAGFKALLTDHQQQVVLDGERTEPVRGQSGVPQGILLSPLMFILYINDIGKINHINVCLHESIF